MNIESLSLIAKLAKHQGAEVAELTAQVVAEGKDSKRLFRGTVRSTIYKRDKGVCFYCGTEIKGTFHIDHVIPHTLGGRTHEVNGVLSCPPCNIKKGKRIW